MKITSKNHYKVLGVSPNASDEEIKQAFHDFAKNNHPDRNPENENSEHLFKEASQAYEVLKDPLRRQALDDALAFERTNRRAGRRQGRRLLMLFALLLLTPSVIISSVLISKDKTFIDTYFSHTGTTTENTDTEIAAATPTGGGGNRLDREATASSNTPEPVNSENAQPTQKASLDENGQGQSIGQTEIEQDGATAALGPSSTSQSTPVKQAALNQSTPIPGNRPSTSVLPKTEAKPAQTPIPDEKITAPAPEHQNAAPEPQNAVPEHSDPAPERPKIVLTANVDLSAPFSDCNHCPLMHIPRRPIPELEGTDRAISIWSITLHQWNTCVNDGACPKYEKGFLKDSEPVTGLKKDEAERYASWLSKITNHTYAVILDEGNRKCTSRQRPSTSNRWDWMQDFPEQNCAGVSANDEGFRVTRVNEPAS